MSEELGKIVKPDAELFRGKRKICLIPLLFSWDDAPEEYVEKLKTYWQQVDEQIVNLELRIGKVNRIYHESISTEGEEGRKILEKLNPAGCYIVNNKCESGAELVVIEDEELISESMDWERHLLVGFISNKVAGIISDYYKEASDKRYEHILRKIDETLKNDEVAMLFIREGHPLQFPDDIEVFSVAPPMLDDIHRWLRDRSATEQDY